MVQRGVHRREGCAHIAEIDGPAQHLVQRRGKVQAADITVPMKAGGEPW
jgi:hypothetical protein